MFPKIKLKFSAAKIKKLVEDSVQDAKDILIRHYEDKLQALRLEHKQDLEMLKIRYETENKLLKDENISLIRARTDAVTKYHETQRIADQLKGHIIALGALKETQLETNAYEYQRFKASHKQAMASFNDLAGITMDGKKPQKILESKE